MILPDLQKELAYWVDKLRLGGWKIAIRYEPDPRAPDTGDPVYGYCVRQLDIPSADIVIRTPSTSADIAETHDTIVHELLHCRLANPEGSRVLEENAVWTLAPLLTELRLNAPVKAQMLYKALARRGTPTTARSRALKERYKMLDPEKLAALAMQAGQIIAEEGLPENVKAILHELIALAAGGEPAMPEEPAAPAPIEGKMPEEQMGLQKEDEPMGKVKALMQEFQKALSEPRKAEAVQEMVKSIEQQMATDRASAAADRAAAVEGLLDTRADLKDRPKAVARLREIGLREGVAKLRQDLADLVPAPNPTQPEVRPKLGEQKPVRGSSTMAKAAPSGDRKVDTLFRIVNKDVTRDGVTIPAENTGKLVEFSVVDAFAKIKHTAEQAREEQRARMGGTR